MKLLGVEKIDGHLYAEWTLTFRVGWDQILRSAALIWQYTGKPEVFTGDAYGETKASPGSPEDVPALGEAGYLTIRGKSGILGVPVMITFYNQSDFVRQTVISATEEFEEADYEKFNKSICRYMDSAGIAMYG